MTATLTPYATIAGRLAAAKAERIEPTLLAIQEGSHWTITERWATVPSSGGDDDYHVRIVDEPGQPLRCSCDCQAGLHGVACKHIAAALHDWGLIDERLEYEMMRGGE